MNWQWFKPLGHVWSTVNITVSIHSFVFKEKIQYNACRCIMQWNTIALSETICNIPCSLIVLLRSERRTYFCHALLSHLSGFLNKIPKKQEQIFARLWGPIKKEVFYEHERAKCLYFFVLLTVRLSIILVNVQLDTQFFDFIIRLLQSSTYFDVLLTVHYSNDQFWFQLMHRNFTLLTKSLYMFRAPTCPSSGGQTIHTPQLVQLHLLWRLYGW